MPLTQLISSAPARIRATRAALLQRTSNTSNGGSSVDAEPGGCSRASLGWSTRTPLSRHDADLARCDERPASAGTRACCG
jgi:hypothetical protein